MKYSSSKDASANFANRDNTIIGVQAKNWKKRADCRVVGVVKSVVTGAVVRHCG